MWIFAAAWLLILAGAVIVFRVIVPLTICDCFANSVAKGVLATLLSVVWLSILVAMRNLVVRRTLMKKKEEETVSKS
jgi:ethanolamine transporter EutH